MADPNPFSYAATAQSVHSSLDAALAAIPPGKRGALLATATEGVNGPQGSLMLAAKIGNSWQIAGGGAWADHVGPSAQVALMGSW